MKFKQKERKASNLVKCSHIIVDKGIDRNRKINNILILNLIFNKTIDSFQNLIFRRLKKKTRMSLYLIVHLLIPKIKLISNLSLKLPLIISLNP